MAEDTPQLRPADLVRFARRDPEEWQHLVGTVVIHRSWGRGIVIGVAKTPDGQRVETVSVRLDDRVEPRDLDTSAFETGIVTDIVVSPSVAQRVHKGLHQHRAAQLEFIQAEHYDTAADPLMIQHCAAQPQCEVLCLGTYRPRDVRESDAKPAPDDLSERIIQLKGYHSERAKARAVRYFVDLLDPHLARGHPVAVVPSHDPECLESGIREIAQSLARNGRADATSCLERFQYKQPAKSGGDRSKAAQRATLRVVNADLIRGRRVLLLDDVVTSGASLQACRELLLEAGAAEVQCYALGETVREGVGVRGRLPLGQSAFGDETDGPFNRDKHLGPRQAKANAHGLSTPGVRRTPVTPSAPLRSWPTQPHDDPVAWGGDEVNFGSPLPQTPSAGSTVPARSRGWEDEGSNATPARAVDRTPGISRSTGQPPPSQMAYAADRDTHPGDMTAHPDAPRRWPRPIAASLSAPDVNGPLPRTRRLGWAVLASAGMLVMLVMLGSSLALLLTPKSKPAPIASSSVEQAATLSSASLDEIVATAVAATLAAEAVAETPTQSSTASPTALPSKTPVASPTAVPSKTPAASATVATSRTSSPTSALSLTSSEEPATVECTVVAGPLNVRAGPGAEFAVASRLSQGQIVSVTAWAEDNQWAQQGAGGPDHGWVSARFLECGHNGVGETAPSEPTAVSIRGEALTSAPALDGVKVNIRSGPGLQHEVVAWAEPGMLLRVIGRDEDADWLQVCCVQGESGWIAGTFLAIRGDDALVELPVEATSPTATAGVPQPTAHPEENGGLVIVADSLADFSGYQGRGSWWYLYSVGRNNFNWKEMRGGGNNPDCYRTDQPDNIICRDYALPGLTGDVALQYKAEVGGTIEINVELELRHRANNRGITVYLYRHLQQLRAYSLSDSNPTVVDSLVQAVAEGEFFFLVFRAVHGNEQDEVGFHMWVVQ